MTEQQNNEDILDLEEGMIIRLKQMVGKNNSLNPEIETGENIMIQTEEESTLIVIDFLNKDSPYIDQPDRPMLLSVSMNKLILLLYEDDFNLLIKTLQENMGEQQILFDIPNDPTLTNKVFMQIDVKIESILLKCFQGSRSMITTHNLTVEETARESYIFRNQQSLAGLTLTGLSVAMANRENGCSLIELGIEDINVKDYRQHSLLKSENSII